MSVNDPVPPMPFFGREFFEAVSMFSDSTSLKYIRALWFYWSHTHCQGLPNDDEGLRILCKCDTQDWMRVRGQIFDNDKFFVLDAGKWHQRKCRHVYQKHIALLEANRNKTEPARNQSIVKRTVSESVTDSAWLKSLSDNPAYAGVDIQRELGKLAAWCNVAHKEVTRRRFINWLNRAERPLTGANKERIILKSTPPPALKGEEATEEQRKQWASKLEEQRKKL